MQIAEVRPETSFEVLSNPEFLAEGEAIKNLLSPDRVLIGSASTNTGQAAASALAEIYSSWVDPVRIQKMSNSSAELAKLAANAMLAQRISSINAVSAICEQTGADIQDVQAALGSDSRIGSDFLQAGIGFGGSCFRKDILNLSCLADSLNLSTVGEYWRQILQINNYQCDRFVQRVISKLGGSLSDKKIIIFGWAFKKGTSDPRESRSIEVFKALWEKSVGEIAVFDPRYRQSDLQEEIVEIIDSVPWEKRNPSSMALASGDPYKACHLADAILILTDWDHFRCRPTTAKPPYVTSGNPDPGDASGSSSTCFRKDVAPSEVGVSPSWLSTYQEKKISNRDKKLLKIHPALLKPEPSCPSDRRDFHAQRLSPWGDPNDQVDWSRIATAMKRPAWVFDGRNMVDIAEMERLGFRVEAIGKARA
jgi:UDPglucose 6-dehydrogenase